MFALRRRDRNRVDQDLGLLHAVDERLSVWGWETGTGARFAIVLDMWGREGVEGTGLGVKEGELKSVGYPLYDILCDRSDQGIVADKAWNMCGETQAFRALQTAYIRLLQNPFYKPDEHTAAAARSGMGQGPIKNKMFIKEIERIGMAWKPGVTNI